MHQLLTSTGLLVGCLAVGTIPTVAQDSSSSRTDPASAIRFFDANGDQKLSLEEFLKLAERNARLKGNVNMAKQVFKRLDSDSDGVLTAREFSQLRKPQGTPTPTPTPPRTPTPTPTGSMEQATKKAFSEFVTTPTVEQTTFFEKKIRPVLVTECYSCHSGEADKMKGGLALDTRDGFRSGGDSGPSIVPGLPEKSLLVTALRHTDNDLQMPPKHKLSAAVVADFEQWVRIGAPDPRDGEVKLMAKEDTWEVASDWWAWQPAKKTLAPKVIDATWPKTDIDRFLLAAMESKGLKPVGDADKLTLLRRVTFDLTGLPPTMDDIEAFRQDSSPDAIRVVVERLLDSPQFGEKWGRHWLDVARYAESTGKDINLTYPEAWRYRDYVIAAFNQDKPYDQFLLEQIAGDLLNAKNDKQRAEQLVATGFLGIWNKERQSG